MNFVSTFRRGREGKNIGLPTGIKALDKAIYGVQRKTIVGIAAAAKAGKTTFTDFCFVINPYLYSLEHPEVDIEWDYFSYEIDRVTKEFDFAAFFFYFDYQIDSFIHNGKKYLLSPSYLLGKMKDEKDNIIKVQPDHEKILKEIYLNRIIPLFGEWTEDNKMIKPGKIRFLESRDNPTGMRNYLLKRAENDGKFLFENYIDSEGHKQKRRIGYIRNNPDAYRICITDHIRKLKRERGYSAKENIDKWVEYQVELRNMCHYTFIDIIHLNRNLTNIDRLKFDPEHLYPMSDDVKDTGNLSEEANYMLTLFNPTDEKYGIETHFGVDLSEYPNYRSIHVVESRDSECPVHLQTQLFGHIKSFKSI